ncbi:NmrA/HSCARG family protein [Streptomyces sp. NBC_01218]|uniref:NmrA/HSCARG family protein n=1 Tax=unclassified Streptomyces TaxID=2593676 RepID=UPI0023B9CB4E|nr:MULTISPECIES: NmrA/HSCARG family protein [unclassified Streptomyces]WEH38049.1 NmrA/HSCARG family protein [Streptomyces sp. AM 2-1-1]WEH43490.1 NmrA/HSCARG family protein [Streptomyces sp. AM 2-1-1]WSQ49709.1 NmrA/HSCARG family protein [Streptomyces sp. NBC_01218]WSQ55133.1 NmrA/HSCARG family protein [Streptomyces sp. NBC_01218]
MNSDTVLVTGATGQQGGATARALLAAEVPVRALVRDPRSKAAQAIEALGAELVRADLSDRASLGPAVEGIRAVFSVQMPPMNETGVDFAGELAQAANLVDAAKAGGVRQFVQSSTSGVGEHTRAPGWAESRWAAMADYFHTKQAIMEAVRGAGFARWTVIKPAFFMENLPLLAPRGPRGGLLTVLKPDTELALVAARDIGTAAAHALRDPDRFHEVELELAGDLRTMEQIAQTLSAAWGVPVTAPSMSLEEALDAGMPKWGAGHEWNNAVLQPARPEFARELGIPVTTFAEWADEQLTPVSG